jgi:hypothetical protein
MKKYFFGLLICLIQIPIIYSQELNFTAKIDTIPQNSNSLNITVNIYGGQPNYIVYLMDDVPYQGGKIITYGSGVDTYTFRFTNIIMQNFYVCVVDEKKSMTCKKNSKLSPSNQ